MMETTKALNLERISDQKSNRIYGETGDVKPKMKTPVVKALGGDNLLIGGLLTESNLAKNVIGNAIWITMETLSALSERPA